MSGPAPHLQSNNLALGRDEEMAVRNKIKNINGDEGEKPVMHDNF